MKQVKYTENENQHLIDQGGNHFVNGKCINPIAGEGEIGDTYKDVNLNTTTQSGVVKTGRINAPIQFVDEYKRVITIEP